MSIREGSDYIINDDLISARSAQNESELAEIFMSQVESAGFEVQGDYDEANLVGRDTGLAVGESRQRTDEFERPEIDPRLTFRLQDWDNSPNDESVENYPIEQDIPEFMITGDMRIPVEEPVTSQVASGKTSAAESLGAEDPYVWAGERSIDLSFAVTDANPPGTIGATLENIREIGEAQAYIQDQNLPPRMAINAFRGRINENKEPQTPNNLYDSIMGEYGEEFEELADEFEVTLESPNFGPEEGYAENIDTSGLDTDFYELEDESATKLGDNGLNI